MTDQSEWIGRVGQVWAGEWRATDRSFAPVTERLLDHPAARSFSAALDVGCGAGELACRLAASNPSARVTGVDVSPSLLAVARERCDGARFVEADAARFVPEGPAPDLVVSRHGGDVLRRPSGGVRASALCRCARRDAALLLLPRPRGK